MSKLSLTIWRVEQTCNFVLSWGQNTQLTAKLKLFPNLIDYYQVWQQAYLKFYCSSLRGRAKQAGSFPTPSVDWRVRLAQAEANLLSEFHRWLASQELLEIRQQIANIVATLQGTSVSPQAVDLFLQCDDDELARLPWETWEIGREFGSAGSVRLARTPGTIREETSSHQRHGKLRLLAILGDDTGLDFQREREALRALASLVDIQFVGWQQGKQIPALRKEIAAAISDPAGWDVLFFAGHSNETNNTGGELAIAPNAAILLSEIAPQLAEAKLHGLKFALFNSCKGLSLAKALIDLGLSQVAVMREPIHNAVAQDFLVAFVQALARHEDIHQALRSACQFLKLERNLTFPSAALVPSLFQHPGAIPFRLEPVDLKSQLRRWLPTKREAIAVGCLACLSWLPTVQRELIEQRLLTQAKFRQLIGQSETIGASQASPPVLLIQVDEESVQDVYPIRPLNRSYLSQIIAKANALEISPLGLDYVLDRTLGEDLNSKDNNALRSALSEAHQNNMEIVFAVHLKNGRWHMPHPEVTGEMSKQLGDIMLFGNENQAVLHARVDTALAELDVLPFSRMLAEPPNATNPAQQPLQTSWVTQLSYAFGQTWLHPLIDYSLPPTAIYQRISSDKFLSMSASAPELAQRQGQVALIAAGYSEAGVDDEGQDTTKRPKAMQFWLGPYRSSPTVHGGNIHAYHIHHQLRQAFIIPLPDIWFVGLAAIVGKWRKLSSRGKRRQNCWVIITGAAGIYGMVTLQLYITTQVLVPWLLPILTLGIYGLSKSED